MYSELHIGQGGRALTADPRFGDAKSRELYEFFLLCGAGGMSFAACSGLPTGAAGLVARRIGHGWARVRIGTVNSGFVLDRLIALFQLAADLPALLGLGETAFLVGRLRL